MGNVLVTGASGFIGNNLARRLLAEGRSVHLLLRPGHQGWRVDDIIGSVTVHRADLLDLASIRSAVQAAKPLCIFHLAVYGAYASQSNALHIFKTNALGTAHLLEAALEVGFDAFVNTGSSSEYGFQDHPPREDEAVEPNSAYAAAKAAATLWCRETAHRTGQRIPTLRLYSAYGPYEEPTRLIPTLITKGLAGSLPPLTNPETARDFVFVEDVVDAYLLAAATPLDDTGAVLNVGTGEQTTLREVVRIAGKIFDIPAEPQWATMADRSWDTGVWVADPTLIKKTLGWSPRHRFEDGFARTVEWFRANEGFAELYAGWNRQPT